MVSLLESWPQSPKLLTRRRPAEGFSAHISGGIRSARTPSPKKAGFSPKLLVLALTIFASSLLVYSQSLPGDRFALIIGGIGGQEEFTEKYFAQTSQMYDVLVDSLGYKPSNVVYLFAEASLDSLRIDDVATAENVGKAFSRLSGKMESRDQLLVFMVGHGTFDGDWAKFNLVGPDLRDLDFAKLLADLPTKKIVLVNTTSSSGPFVQKLSRDERVIITATKSGGQIYETNFADFFLEAVASPEADLDKDKRISVKEAFTFARANQDRWFEEERRMRAEHPVLDDNGDGKGSKELADSEDGSWASRVYLNPISPAMESSLARIKSGAQTRTDSLMVEKISIEQEIDDLKTRKEQLDGKEYSRRLEELLIRLAKVNREIKKLGATESNNVKD